MSWSCKVLTVLSVLCSFLPPSLPSLPSPPSFFSSSFSSSLFHLKKILNGFFPCHWLLKFKILAQTFQRFPDIPFGVSRTGILGPWVFLLRFIHSRHPFCFIFSYSLGYWTKLTWLKPPFQKGCSVSKSYITRLTLSSCLNYSASNIMYNHKNHTLSLLPLAGSDHTLGYKKCLLTLNMSPWFDYWHSVLSSSGHC